MQKTSLKFATIAAFIMMFVTIFIGKLNQTAEIIVRQKKTNFIRADEYLPTRIPKYNEQNKTSTVFISSLDQMTSYLDEHGWPLIVSMSTGGLGNNIHNYAMNLVLQQKFPNASFGVTHQLYQYVRTVFATETLQLPLISEKLLYHAIPKNMTKAAQPRLDGAGDFSTYIIPAVKSVMGKRCVLLLEAYGLNIFAGYEEFLFNTLRIKDDIKQKASKFLERTELRLSSGRNVKDLTFVGMHIRRGHYVEHVKIWSGVRSLPGRSYYKKALKYYRNRLKHPVFVVASDDQQYVKRAFRNEADVVYSGNRTAAEDFAILASCTHSIMTIGTFGFWSSFFAGGRVIFAVLKGSLGFDTINPEEMDNAFQNVWWFYA